MNNLIASGNVALLALNLSTLGTVAYKGRLWEPKSEAPASEVSLRDSLGLSPLQAERIESQREAFVNDWGERAAEIHDSRQALLDAIRKEGREPQEYWPLVEEIARRQADLEKQAIVQLLRERDLLTPEQRQEYLSRVENRLRQGWGSMQPYRGGRGRGTVGAGPPSGQEQQEGYPSGGQSGRGGKGRGKGRRGWQ